MITQQLARALAAAGLAWTPTSGDRFAIPDRDMDNQVFVVSDMTIEVDRYPSGGLVKFNGTTEWALDSIAQSQVLWLPRESDLRRALGEHFSNLSRSVVGDELVSYAVVLSDGRRFVDADCECAYARALLDCLG